MTRAWVKRRRHGKRDISQSVPASSAAISFGNADCGGAASNSVDVQEDLELKKRLRLQSERQSDLRKSCMTLLFFM